MRESRGGGPAAAPTKTLANPNGRDTSRTAPACKADRCALCDRAYGHGDILYLGRRGRKRLVTGECCAARLRVVEAIGLYFDKLQLRAEDVARRGGCGHRGDLVAHDGDSTAWSLDDRHWFATRPHRAHRLRLAFAGEFDQATPPPGFLSAVVVRQVEPGERLRLWLGVTAIVDLAEAQAHALFDAVAKGSLAGLGERTNDLAAAEGRVQ